MFEIFSVSVFCLPFAWIHLWHTRITRYMSLQIVEQIATSQQVYLENTTLSLPSAAAANCHLCQNSVNPLFSDRAHAAIPDSSACMPNWSRRFENVNGCMPNLDAYPLSWVRDALGTQSRGRQDKLWPSSCLLPSSALMMLRLAYITAFGGDPLLGMKTRTWALRMLR